MQEILYDMIHNSIWGIISLFMGGFFLLYCALFLGLRYIWLKYHKKYDLSIIKRFLEKNRGIRKIHFVMPVTAGGIFIVTLVPFFFRDWRVVHEKYSYIQTEMAEQKSLDILFSNEIQIEVNENEDMRNLHIAIDPSLTKITKKEIEKRADIFAAIYQVEIKSTDTEILVNSETEEDIRKFELEVKERSKEFKKYQEEYEKYSADFENSRLPASLYQSSRAARDILEVGRSECDDEELLKIAADSVHRSEVFLKYDNRNVNTEDAPVIIEAKDVLFYNGKVFYQLYLEAENRDVLKECRNDFIVNAYVCMYLAGEEITEDDKEYAKINYYIGNIREKMLNKISIEDSFYKENIDDAIEHYTIALNSMQNRPDYYYKEDNMENNCNSGIVTLTNE